MKALGFMMLYLAPAIITALFFLKWTYALFRSVRMYKSSRSRILGWLCWVPAALLFCLIGIIPIATLVGAFNNMPMGAVGVPFYLAFLYAQPLAILLALAFRYSTTLTNKQRRN